MRASIMLAALAVAIISCLAQQPASQPAAVIDLKALGEQFKPVVEPITGGQVDWTVGMVCAVGEGKMRGNGSNDLLMAQRAARLVALRNCLLLAGGVRTGPGGKFADFKEGRLDMEALVKDFRKIDSDYDPVTHTVTSRMGIPFFGPKGLSGLVSLTVSKPGKGWQWPPAQSHHIAVASCIFIDVRGQGFRPCLLPRIVTESDETVFDPAGLPASRLPAEGAFRYVALEAKFSPKELIQARVQARALPYSLVLTAAKAADGRVVLDGKQLDALSVNTTKDRLDNFDVRLILILDPPAGKQP